MNAQSYLQSFGWTPGTALGNPLSHAPSSSSCPSANRLTKRILTSAKNNTLGVGRKQSNLNHADLWWEKAFDVSLKKLDVTKDTTAIPQQRKDVVDNMNLFADLGGGRGFGGTALPAEGKTRGGKKVEHSSAPLYRYFVRGQGLEGTMTSISTTTTTTTTVVQTETTVLEETRPSKKRKRDDDDDKDTSSLSKSERKALKAERKQLRAERRAAKTERRRLRAERRAAKEEKRKLKAEKKAKKEAKKAESSSSSLDEDEDEEGEDEKHVQSDSGVDMSNDEASVEEEVVTEKKEKRKDKKKIKEESKDTASDTKQKKEKESDRKAKESSKKKKSMSSR